MSTRKGQSNTYLDILFPVPADTFVTVVVPAYLSASTIDECLKSLISQKYPKEYLEIIVIDSGYDETKHICRNYDVRYYHSTRKLSAGAARNIGARMAKGQILAFLDADCIAPEYWIYHLVRDFDAFPETFGVLGVYAGGKSCLDKIRGGELMSNEKRIGFHRGFIEGNVAFRRKVFEAGCSFGDMTYGECVKLSNDLSKRGMKTLWDPTLKVLHKGYLNYRKMFAMDRAYARISLMEENTSLLKGTLKLLFIMAMLIFLPIWPLIAIFLFFSLLLICSAFSLTDNMVSFKNRIQLLPVLICMRLSRFFASATESALYLLRWRAKR